MESVSPTLMQLPLARGPGKRLFVPILESKNRAIIGSKAEPEPEDWAPSKNVMTVTPTIMIKRK